MAPPLLTIQPSQPAAQAGLQTGSTIFNVGNASAASVGAPQFASATAASTAQPVSTETSTDTTSFSQNKASSKPSESQSGDGMPHPKEAAIGAVGGLAGTLSLKAALGEEGKLGPLFHVAKGIDGFIDSIPGIRQVHDQLEIWLKKPNTPRFFKEFFTTSKPEEVEQQALQQTMAVLEKKSPEVASLIKQHADALFQPKNISGFKNNLGTAIQTLHSQSASHPPELVKEALECLEGLSLRTEAIETYSKMYAEKAFLMKHGEDALKPMGRLFQAAMQSLSMVFGGDMVADVTQQGLKEATATDELLEASVHLAKPTTVLETVTYLPRAAFHYVVHLPFKGAKNAVTTGFKWLDGHYVQLFESATEALFKKSIKTPGLGKLAMIAGAGIGCIGFPMAAASKKDGSFEMPRFWHEVMGPTIGMLVGCEFGRQLGESTTVLDRLIPAASKKVPFMPLNVSRKGLAGALLAYFLVSPWVQKGFEGVSHLLFGKPIIEDPKKEDKQAPASPETASGNTAQNTVQTGNSATDTGVIPSGAAVSTAVKTTASNKTPPASLATPSHGASPPKMPLSSQNSASFGLPTLALQGAGNSNPEKVSGALSEEATTDPLAAKPFSHKARGDNAPTPEGETASSPSEESFFSEEDLSTFSSVSGKAAQRPPSSSQTRKTGSSKKTASPVSLDADLRKSLTPQMRRQLKEAGVNV